MKKNAFISLAFCVVIAILAANTAQAQAPSTPRINTTSGAASLEPNSKSSGIVYWTRTLQEIDGFGASGAFRMARNLMNFPEPQRSEVLDILFSPSSGAGLTIVRNIVGDGGTVGGASPTIQPQEGVWDWTVDEDQIWLMKEAGKRGATRYISTVWSPPAWMKTNNNVVGGRLRPDKYLAFAEYLSMYIRGYKEHHGIDIYAISLANEPNVTVRYSSCYWNGKEFHDFLKFLIPVFERDKITTKVVVGEHAGWTENPVLESLEDSITAARVDIVGVHAYDTREQDPYPPIAQRSGPLVTSTEMKKKIWQTEVSNLGTNIPDIRDGIYWAKIIHTHIADNGINAWLYWWAVTSPNSGQGMVHLDSKTKTYTVDKRLYTMGNYSRFVKPGYYRVQVNGDYSTGVLVSAYKSEPENKLVIVVINDNVKARSLDLKFDGITSTTASQWRTSATENLAGVGELKITDGILKANLAPSSVTTFVLTVVVPQ